MIIKGLVKSTKLKIEPIFYDTFIDFKKSWDEWYIYKKEENKRILNYKKKTKN